MTKEIQTIVKRVKAPTPCWFKKLRNIGLTVGAVGAVLLSAPISLPSSVLLVAGYMTIAGGVMGAVSQTAVK